MWAPCPTHARFPSATGSAIAPAHKRREGAPFDQDFVELVNASAQSAWGRSVTVRSAGGRAFDVIAEWTAGGSQGGTLRATAPGGVLRFNVGATTLRIRGATWWDADDRLSVGVDDTGVTGNNDLSRGYIFTANPGFSDTFDVPTYGREVSLLCANPAQRANILVELLNDVGTTLAAGTGLDVLPLTWAQQIRVTNNNVAAAVISPTVSLRF